MRIITDSWHSRQLPHGTVAAIGNFDGIHRGQRAIFDRVTERAGEKGLQSVVVTFEPHPVSVLRPDEAPPRLTTLEQKSKLLEDIGVDVLAVVSFTADFSQTPAEVFVEEFLHRRLGVDEIVVGSRFAFGRQRGGDLELLERMAVQLGFEVRGIEEVQFRGEPISSTRIRRAVRAGELEEAYAMLDRSYSIRGLVSRGEGRGKTLGWPTINIEPQSDLLPADGVYVSKVEFPQLGSVHGCVTNIGCRPTFPDGPRRVVESHILDFDQEVYGAEVELHFLERLRDERAFPSGKALAEQIARDVAEAREYLSSDRCLLERAAADE
ncbi:MAG: bifunctional riboflavin kinase/FAD synthetase [Acidobacteria bacterium]|nr:MAG: bifunctional riboflavin kinase/FAD synthetase [Acidobacteriota bacterium]